MAQMAVNILVQQMGPLLIEEAKLLSWVKEDIVQIRNELQIMEATLKDADRRKQSDNQVQLWVEQVRELAYYVEDSLDEFLYLMRQPLGQGVAGFLHKCRRHTKHYLVERLRISCQVRILKRRISNVSQLRDRFALAAQSSNANTSSSSRDPRLTDALFAEESQLVGIDGPRDELIEMLIGGGEAREVVSIVGMGGLGKTTLARRVFKSERVERGFKCRAWITVSQAFNSEELLRELGRTFFRTAKSEDERDLKDMNYVQLVERLISHLNGERYFIILDDVWSTNAWDDFKFALPENGYGSRVIITTRIAEVAYHCTNTPSHVYRLRPLSENASWALFCKKAFKLSNNDSCPSELEELSKNILKSCEGLPLAIVLVGGLLSKKNPTLAEWDLVRRSLGAELEDGEQLGGLKRILWLSYEDLPYHLKPCYLYFGMFPEDHHVNRGMLTRQLVAEGLIVPVNGKTLEEVAEDYIHQLISRSLIQVEELDAYGRVKRCRVHDLLHDLIVSQCRGQNFIIVAQGEAEYPDRIRRLSVQTAQSVPENTSFSQVRSLFMFPDTTIPSFSGFKMLKVLSLQGVALQIFPTEILKLYHLKYLNLRKTNIKVLPNSIGKLQKLQTLDLKHMDLQELPEGIVDLIRMHNILIYGGQKQAYGASLPTMLGSLRSLQKLCFLKLNGKIEQVRELGKLTQLRNLGLTGVRSEDVEALSASVRNMSQLQSLIIELKDQNEIVDLQSLLTQPLLRRLTFYGRLVKLPDLIGSFNNLVKIGLGNSGLTVDPFQILQYLPSLVDLRIKAAYDGLELSCEADAFGKLKFLGIAYLYNLRLVNIKEGAMPHVEKMVIHSCPSLYRAPYGIEHLVNLKELQVSDMPELFRSIETVDWVRVRRIPQIYG